MGTGCGDLFPRKHGKEETQPRDREAANLAWTPSNEQKDAGRAGLFALTLLCFLATWSQSHHPSFAASCWGKGIDFPDNTPTSVFSAKVQDGSGPNVGNYCELAKLCGEAYVHYSLKKITALPVWKRSNINIGNVCPIRRTAVSSHSQLQNETLQVICCCCGCGGWKPGWKQNTWEPF